MTFWRSPTTSDFGSRFQSFSPSQKGHQQNCQVYSLLEGKKTPPKLKVLHLMTSSSTSLLGLPAGSNFKGRVRMPSLKLTSQVCPWKIGICSQKGNHSWQFHLRTHYQCSFREGIFYEKSLHIATCIAASCSRN